MLNTALIEEFQRINASRQTGALAVQVGQRTVRFFFEQGELCVLDYCQDKEDLVARQYRIYNKIGAEMEAALLDHVRQGGRSQDFLTRQQLVTAEEIEQVTRTLVEDTLCEVFGNEHQSVNFDSNVRYEDFDFSTLAVKLRIQVDMLLRMVSSRVAERDSVVREIPEWTMIFGLVEGAPDAQRLNEMERCVLHFIDGHKTVSDISSALRESSMNIGCYLVSLMVQGYIRPSGYGTRSSLRAAVDGQAQSPDQQPEESADPGTLAQDQAGSPGEIRNFEVYRGSDSAMASVGGRRRAPLFILLCVLLVMVGIFVLVVMAEYAQEQIGELRRQIEQDIEAAAWQEADERLAEAFTLAAGDETIRAQLMVFRDQINERDLTALLDGVDRHLDQEDLILARAELGRLPHLDHRFAEGGLWSRPLLQRLRQLHQRADAVEQSIHDRTQELEERVIALLDAKDVDRVIVLLDEEPQNISSGGRRALRQWRRRAIDQAADETVLSLTARRELLHLVMQSNPPAEMKESAQQILRELQEIDSRLEREVLAIEATVESGDYMQAEEQLASWRQRAEGHPIEARLDGIEAAIAHARSDAESRLQATLTLIESSRDPAALEEGRSAIASYLERAPRSSLAVALRQGQDLLAVCRAALDAATIEQELAALPEDVQDMYEVYAAAIAHRRRGLRDLVLAADREMQRAQELRQARQWSQALQVLEELRDNEQWRRTAAYQQVQAQIDDLRQRISAHAARLETLRAAMIDDDMDLVAQLLRELDLRRHVFCIRSSPAGATVIDHEGTELGTTPFVVEESSDAPVRTYRLSLAGYAETTVNRQDRSAGWRIHRTLERAPAIVASLGSSVTNVPSVHDGSLWLAGPRAIYRVDRAGGVHVKAFEGPHGGIFRPVPSPIYAPVTMIDEVPMLPTRDLFAINIGPEHSVRRSLGGRTDHALVSYISEMVVDRHLLIVAGTDGAVHAHDPNRQQTVWSSVAGAPFVSGPIRHGDRILIARRDGTLMAMDAETGQRAVYVALGEPLLSMQSDGSRIYGVTTTQSWRWDGEAAAASTERLPFEAAFAGPGAAISTNRRAWQRLDDGTWVERGRLSIVADVKRAPIAWGNQVVVTYDRQLQVIGDRPFAIEANDSFLQPVAEGDDVWMVSLDGEIRRFQAVGP